MITPSPTANAQDVTANDWIDWNGGECPIPHLKAGEYQLLWRGKERDENGDLWDQCWPFLLAGDLSGWQEGGSITAYRVVQS